MIEETGKVDSEMIENIITQLLDSLKLYLSYIEKAETLESQKAFFNQAFGMAMFAYIIVPESDNWKVNELWEHYKELMEEIMWG